MMNLEELKTLPTTTLINFLSNNTTLYEWNMIIFELTCRMYVPFNQEGISFDELLVRNGYKIQDLEQQKRK